MGLKDSSFFHVGAIGAVVLLTISANAQAAEPRLPMFLHVAVKQRALPSELENALRGTTVTAVGRTADFERAQHSSTGAQILALVSKFPSSIGAMLGVA